MNELELSKNVLLKIIEQDIPFASALKSSFKKDITIDGTVRSNVTALVGCELRHHYLLSHLMEKYFGDAEFSKTVFARFLIANQLFLKRYQNKDIYLLAVKDLPKDQLDEMVDFINTTQDIIPDTMDKTAPEYLALRFNTPSWIIKMWQKQYGKGLVFKILKTNYKHSIPSLRVNTKYFDTDSFLREHADFAPSVVPDIVFYNGKGSPKGSKEFVENKIFFMKAATKYVVDRLDIEPMRGVAIYSEVANNIHLDLLTRFDESLHLEVISNHYGNYLEVKNHFDNVKYPHTAVYEAEYNSLITCLAEPVGTFFCLPKNTAFDLLRSAPDYFLRIKQDMLDGIIANELATLQECAKFVEVGGKLVYLVPTICKKESSGLIGTFLFNNPDYQLLEEQQFFPFDRFDSCLYYAILQKVR